MSMENELPVGWVMVKIKDVFDFLGGGTPSKQNPDFWNGNLNWASVKDIKGDYLIGTEDKITALGAESSATNIANPGDVILVTRINPGRTIISKIQTAINQDLKIVKPKFDTHYGFIKLLFNYIEKQCINLSSGTTVLGLSLNNLNEIEIPLPPLPEQHRIVAKIEELFSDLDNGIESLKTAQAQLKVYRQAVLKAAFEGKLTEQAGKEGELPEGWTVDLLANIAFVVDPQPSHRTPPEEVNGIPYVSIKDCDYGIGKINLESARKVSKNVLDEHVNRYVLELNDFIIGKIGTIGQPIPVVLPQNYSLSANLVLIQPRKINSRYLYYYFQSYEIEKEFKKGQNATAQAAFGIQKVKALQVLFPPTQADQQAIVSAIESRLSVCDKLEEIITESLQEAEALRQSILKRAFEGKLVPQDHDDEPASELLARIKAERAEQSTGVRTPKKEKPAKAR